MNPGFMRRHISRTAALALCAVTAAVSASCNLLPPKRVVEAPLPPAVATPLPVTPGGRAELLWDTYGVPHIFAKDVEAAAWAFGWSQMRAHGDLLLRLYAQSRGQGAALLGEPFVASDQWVLTNDVPERALEWLAQQRSQERGILDAFVGGINAYAEQHADSINATYRPVLPVRPEDVLAHTQRVLLYTFIASPQSMLGQARAWQAGSNAWAIAPRRSASGNAMLLANPHLPWGDLFTWFEAQIATPQSDAYGASLIGFPLLSIGFNDSIGWTHTVNTIDNADIFELTLSGDGYMYDGVARAFETKQKVLKVKLADGSIVDRPFTVRHSVHGPVVSEKPGRALALRIAGTDAPHLVQQTWEAMTSRNLADFEHALSRLQLPLFTTIYADHSGNILSVFNGRVPIRSRGNAGYWDYIVPGDSSSTMWNDVLAYDRLPRVINPPTGWVQNANESPWSTTLPMQMDLMRFPDYIAPPPHMSFRAIRSARMIAEDSSMTFDELIAYKHSTRVEEADHIMEDVLHAARIGGSTAAREAAAVLEKWDRTTDADSRGAVLFLEFARAFNNRAARGLPAFDAPWSPRAPLATPDGIADPTATLRVLEAAADRVKARYGSLDVSWGETRRVRRDSVDLPANGGPGDIGVFRVVDFDSVAPTRSYAVGGDSFVMAVEFSKPVRARTSLVYGNWSQPGSKHRTDQLELFARKELKTVWRKLAEVQANMVFREVF